MNNHKYKVAVITTWWWREKFIPVYNKIWTTQTYKNYNVHVFEETYTLNKKNTHQFDSSFHIHPIITKRRQKISKKLNYAFDVIMDMNYDYVMLAASDDYYAPEYIEKCLNFMIEQDLELINMSSANYINLRNMCVSTYNTSQSFSGLFFFKSSLLKYRWNESKIAGEDRYMLNLWKRLGVKYKTTDIHKPYWLGIIHEDNISTHAKFFKWKKIDESWLMNYINDKDIYNFYASFKK